MRVNSQKGSLGMMLALSLAVGVLAWPGLASAAHATAITPTNPDGDIPGAAAKTLPVDDLVDSLSAASDPIDVYAIELSAGQRIVIDLTDLSGAGTTDFDLALYAPGSTSVDAPAGKVDVAETDGSDETISYVASTSGTYYVEVRMSAGSGDGSYDLWCAVKPPDADGELPGISKTTPFSVSDSLDPTSDWDDVYALPLTAGQTLNVKMSGDAGTDFDLFLFSPDVQNVEVGDVVASSITDYSSSETFSYTVPKSGVYYLDAYGRDGGSAGSYTLSATAASSTACSMSIRTTATTVRRGRQFILSGAVSPSGMLGKMVVVWVKKPGKTYWTYSSNRIVYASGSSAAWQYKYTTLSKMALGTYYFRTSYNGGAGFLKFTTRSIAVKLVR